ncbi:hypothetical protein DACRYDRAFT_107243 [Dacryopinax primogenitus]|uniref:Brl1/Brr6 domain-containing protein n=1 Tax=Dacryopinax primogenitus (strain DJM 731) TaxID=1858805 RepID=M5GDE3_DACPD|nr:uncharacterized protein DACRYDRAFT_107243 [Dacryopinax primogenitus]EJU02313.1 hypothetical protein DACRYDRAFT_107243 [Dacryopinax primogenitus]
MDYERTRQGFASSLFSQPGVVEERDTSAPMDVDRPSYMQGEYDSPPRKRPHIDPSPGPPVFPPSRTTPAYPPPFSQPPPSNTPWLFDTDSVAFHPGAVTPTPVEEIKDVEMSNVTEGEETEREKDKAVKPAGKKPKKAKQREPEQDTTIDLEDTTVKGREVALGGYKRVMKKRRQAALQHQPNQIHGNGQPSLTQQIFWPYPVPSAPPLVRETDYAGSVWAWCRAVFNSLLLLFVFLSVSSLLYSVFRDVGSRIEHHNSEYSIQVQECIDKRLRNHCDSDFVGPELRLQCLQWENCIKRDTRSLGYTKVIAQVLAEVLDEFASNVSWRMVAMFLSATAVILIAANFKPFPAPARPEPSQVQPSHTPNFQFVPPSTPFPFPPVQPPPAEYDMSGPRIEELEADDERSMDALDGRIKLLEGLNGGGKGRKW